MLVSSRSQRAKLPWLFRTASIAPPLLLVVGSGIVHRRRPAVLLPVSSLLLDLLPRRTMAGLGFIRPDLAGIAVEFSVGLCARRQCHPGLLGGCEDVGIRRRTLRRVVHRADAHEPHRSTRAWVIAPDRDLADRAARDALALAARRGRVDDLGFGTEVLDPVELIQCVERMHAAGLALTPGAMTGMHHHRLAVQPIADISASAPTFHCSLLVFPRPHIPEQEA